MLDRRAFLARSASAGVAAGLTAVSGCAGEGGLLGRSVKVAVPWSGRELTAFRSVLSGLVTRGYRVDLVPLGDDIGTLFRRHQSRWPDVVLLSQPGLVQEFRDRLEPLRGPVVDAWSSPQRPYPEVWRRLLWLDGRLYGVPFKVTHKSVVWYRRSVFAEFGLTPPGTWTQWRALNDVLVRRGRTPLALAGADGWMLTDFLENVLAGSAPDAYRRLASNGEHGARLSQTTEVARALELLGEMWSVPGVLAGGATGSLVQQFSDAVVQVFAHGRAAMVAVPDFAESVVREFAEDGGDVDVFPFPRIDIDGRPGRQPLVMGGDVAVVSRGAPQDAHDLVSKLAERNAPLPWIKAGGFLAPRSDTPRGGYSRQLGTLADGLDAAYQADATLFDLSDRLGAIGGSGGLWRVLQDFLARVGGRGAGLDMGHEVDVVMRELNELEE